MFEVGRSSDSRSYKVADSETFASHLFWFRAIGWLLLGAFALRGIPRQSVLVALILVGALATEFVQYVSRRERLERHKRRSGVASQPTKESDTEANALSQRTATSWAEHDSILHDLSNAMTASLFIVRDLTRTLDKRTEPGLARAKSLSQALAKELSGIGEQIRCTRQNARLQPIVGEALQLVEPVERCVEIICRLHPETICRVECDASAKDALVSIIGGEATLKRVVENLLLNACQAQASSTRKKAEVVCQLAATESSVSLVVQDNGPGFPEVVLEAFPSPSLSTKPHGTGMGLYGCYQLVARDGGTLSLSNPAVGGAKVVIGWPRLPATSGTIGSAKEAAMSISGTHARPEPAIRRDALLADKQ